VNGWGKKESYVRKS
jgi:hypothetical protein